MSEIKYKTWISEAWNDYGAGKILTITRKYNLAAFHFAQAAEKAIKALLHYIGEDPWGHEIFNLLLELEKKGSKISDKLKTSAKELEKAYFESRYPELTLTTGPKDTFKRRDANEFQKKAKEIMNFIETEKARLHGKSSGIP